MKPADLAYNLIQTCAKFESENGISASMHGYDVPLTLLMNGCPSLSLITCAYVCVCVQMCSGPFRQTRNAGQWGRVSGASTQRALCRTVHRPHNIPRNKQKTTSALALQYACSVHQTQTNVQPKYVLINPPAPHTVTHPTSCVHLLIRHLEMVPKKKKKKSSLLSLSRLSAREPRDETPPRVGLSVIMRS